MYKSNLIWDLGNAFFSNSILAVVIDSYCHWPLMGLVDHTTYSNSKQVIEFSSIDVLNQIGEFWTLQRIARLCRFYETVVTSAIHFRRAFNWFLFVFTECYRYRGASSLHCKYITITLHAPTPREDPDDRHFSKDWIVVLRLLSIGELRKGFSFINALGIRRLGIVQSCKPSRF